MKAVLTRGQKRALKRVFDRTPLTMRYYNRQMTVMPSALTDGEMLCSPQAKLINYRDFRRLAVYYHHMQALVVPWCGMWLCIEADGHVHS